MLIAKGSQVTFPDLLGLGVFAYYFVRRAGHYCLDWDFDLALFQGSELTNREESTPVFDRSVVTVCFEAERTENLDRRFGPTRS